MLSSASCNKVLTRQNVDIRRVLIYSTRSAGIFVSSRHVRSISSTKFLQDGELAEACNLNIVTSPFPAISHGPYDPLPDVVMQNWKRTSGSIKQGTGRAQQETGFLSDELAIYDGSTGMKRTFQEHYNNTKGIAGTLKHELGVDEKACVCLFAPNHVDYLPVTLAVGLCGAKLTPVNPLYKKQELQVVLNRSRSSVVIAHTAILDVALEAVKESTHVKHVIVMTEDGQAVPDGFDSLDSIKRHQDGFDKTVRYIHTETDLHPYLLPYSSGTTGLPKGVCLTQ
jgi:non-ribosomal peptide synthetase component F